MSADLLDVVAGWFRGDTQVGAFQRGDVGKFFKVMKGGDAGNIVILANVFVRDGVEYSTLVDTRSQDSRTWTGDELARLFRDGWIVEVHKDGTPVAVGAVQLSDIRSRSWRRLARSIPTAMKEMDGLLFSLARHGGVTTLNLVVAGGDWGLNPARVSSWPSQATFDPEDFVRADMQLEMFFEGLFG